MGQTHQPETRLEIELPTDTHLLQVGDISTLIAKALHPNPITPIQGINAGGSYMETKKSLPSKIRNAIRQGELQTLDPKTGKPHNPTSFKSVSKKALITLDEFIRYAGTFGITVSVQKRSSNGTRLPGNIRNDCPTISDQIASMFMPVYMTGMVWQGPGMIVKSRRGKIVFRTPGKAGADQDRPPIAIENAREEEAYQSELNKCIRQIRLQLHKPKGIQTRQQKAAELKEEILALAEKYAEKGCHKAPLIAKKTGLSERRVRQILKQEKWK